MHFFQTFIYSTFTHHTTRILFSLHKFIPFPGFAENLWIWLPLWVQNWGVFHTNQRWWSQTAIKHPSWWSAVQYLCIVLFASHCGCFCDWKNNSIPCADVIAMFSLNGSKNQMKRIIVLSVCLCEEHTKQ